jgi:hypothetical protein
LGYFQARQRCFRFEPAAVRDDTDDLRRRHFDNVAVADLAVSLHTRQADGPRGGLPVPAVLRP